MIFDGRDRLDFIKEVILKNLVQNKKRKSLDFIPDFIINII